jgi:Transposase and inactivated derivatives
METVTITKAEYEEFLASKEHAARLERQVEYLLEQMRLARHRQFGSSSEKSEYDTTQLNLFNEAEVTAAPEQSEPELVEVEKHYRKRTRLTTDKLPDDLPLEIVEYELPEAERSCVECGGKLHVMNYDTRRELVIIPAQINIREHRRAIYSCRCCEQTNDHVPIRKADMPLPVILGSFASPAAAAHIMTQKFVMGVPLYRQEQEWQRQGIQLSRQTMSNWLLKTAESWLEPVYERLKAKLLEHDVLHADETTLQVLREPGKTSRSKSYMWLYRTSGDAEHPIVLYEYQNSRKAEHPKLFLKSWRGYLHADGYDGYHKLPEAITVVGCWAHLRRKFDEALKSLPESAREGSLALSGKRFCDQLFGLERQFADLSPEHRYEKRMQFSKPLMAELFAWADSCGALPKTPVGKAVHYAFSQRKYLERYLLDGRLEISNNRAERSIKPFVIGRKNWLFANTPRGAKASAVIYSIIETAKENGLNPYDYLSYIFERAPNLDMQNPENLDLLMTYTFKSTARA